MGVREWLTLPWRGKPTVTDLMSGGERPREQGVTHDEHGVSGTENYGGYIKGVDFNPLLDNWEKAVKTYDQMRRTDANIRAMLQVIKLPLRGATWTCHPASSDPVDTQIADFCNEALFEDDAQEEPWDFTLRHILTQLDYGVAVMEKVWKVDEDGHYRFRKLAPRLARTLREWHVGRDGKLIAIVQYAPVPSSTQRAPTGAQRTPTYGTSVSYQYLTIPAEYTAVFCLEREGDNYEGYSLLRNVYRNWWFKDQAYRTMGVGIDRWGVGIPVAALDKDASLSNQELEKVREVLQAVRSNERAYLISPPGLTFKILPEGGGSGTLGQMGIAWIDHNDSQIARNVLAGFLTMGRDPKGTLGFGSRLTDMFISSLNGIAGGIAGDLKRQLVKPLCDLNFDMSRRKYPDPVCLDLEQVDLENLIEVMAKLTNTVITPQDEDEDVLRKMIGMPKLNPKNSRKTAAEKSAAVVPASDPAQVAQDAAIAAAAQAQMGAGTDAPADGAPKADGAVEEPRP
jgi:hypothetical protein